MLRVANISCGHKERCALGGKEGIGDGGVHIKETVLQKMMWASETLRSRGESLLERTPEQLAFQRQFEVYLSSDTFLT